MQKRKDTQESKTKKKRKAEVEQKGNATKNWHVDLTSPKLPTVTPGDVLRAQAAPCGAARGTARATARGTASSRTAPLPLVEGTIPSTSTTASPRNTPVVEPSINTTPSATNTTPSGPQGDQAVRCVLK